MTEREQAFRRRSDIGETTVEDDLFLVKPETQGIFHLNPVAAALWRLVAEPRTRSEAALILSSAFPDVAPSQISADVERFFDHLVWGGLIVPCPPAG